MALKRTVEDEQDSIAQCGGGNINDSRSLGQNEKRCGHHRSVRVSMELQHQFWEKTVLGEELVKGFFWLDREVWMRYKDYSPPAVSYLMDVPEGKET